MLVLSVVEMGGIGTLVLLAGAVAVLLGFVVWFVGC